MVETLTTMTVNQHNPNNLPQRLEPISAGELIEFIASQGGASRRPDSFRQFINALFKRKAAFWATFLSIFAIVALGTMMMPKIYRSEATILLERKIDTESALLLGVNPQLGRDLTDWVASEIHVLQSRPVMATVVRSLKLYRRGHRRKPRTKTAARKQYDAAVRGLQAAVVLENPKRSNVIQVKYESKNPRLAAAVVNRIVQTYVLYRRELFKDSDAYKFFEKQMKLADQQLRQVEAEKTQFKRKTDLVQPEAQVAISLSKLGDYQKRLTEIQAQRIGKEAKLQILRENYRSPTMLSIPATEISDSPSRHEYISKLRGQLLDLQLHRDKLLQTFTPEYEEVVNLNAQIAAIENTIRSEISDIIAEEESGVRVLKAQERALQNAIGKINRDIMKITENEDRYSQLSRSIKNKTEIYSILLKQREDARFSMLKAQYGVKVRIVSPATVPMRPVKPNVLLNLGLGLFLGLVSGMALVMILEYMDRSVSSPQEVERNLSLPVLASIREFRMVNRPT